jgi:hypothetical protein
MQTQIDIIRATYKTVGPTSVSDSSLARTKKIQVRLGPRKDGETPTTVLWGLKSASKMPNRGDGSQNTRFASVFPRMRF